MKKVLAFLILSAACFAQTAVTGAVQYPARVASVNLTGQTANISTTPLYAVPVSGQYRVSCYTVVTSVGTTSTLPQCTIGWTDADNSASEAAIWASSNSGNTLTTFGLPANPVVMNAKAGTNITYATSSYASTGTPMQYAIHLKVEYLGQ